MSYRAFLNRRIGAAGLALAALVGSTSPIYAIDTLPTGTIIGTVTCGDAHDTPSSYATVTVEGTTLTAHASRSGTFSLSGVPAGRLLTVNVLQGSDGGVGSRYNVSLQPGEMLDIGSLDVPLCPPSSDTQLVDLTQAPPDLGGYNEH